MLVILTIAPDVVDFCICLLEPAFEEVSLTLLVSEVFASLTDLLFTLRDTVGDCHLLLKLKTLNHLAPHKHNLFFKPGSLLQRLTHLIIHSFELSLRLERMCYIQTRVYLTYLSIPL